MISLATKLFILLLIFPSLAFSKTKEYSIVLSKESISITGKSFKRITVNGKIPGPTLEFEEGDEAVIHVKNEMTKDSSIHWHGLLLPGAMDGVPGFNGFEGIKPGETFTYKFPLRQSGTYWYHAHTLTQEQDGLYGSIVIRPKNKEKIKDYVILFSEFHEHEGQKIMSNLKKSSEHYIYTHRTLFDFFKDIKNKGFVKAFKEASHWGQMRMMRTDLSDVNNYTFLVNGKTRKENWTGLFKQGETLKLRFINASSMSIYDVRIPGLKMKVVGADGQPVEPVLVDEFRMAVGETYDMIVKPENKAYSIVAESIDRTGFAVGTLAPKKGMKGEEPVKREMSLLNRADMTGMHRKHSSHTGHGMKGGDHSMHKQKDQDFETGVSGSGWAKAGTPKGHRALKYKDLRYKGVQKKSQPPDREIDVVLGGNMKRYIWTMNGKKFEDSDPIDLKYGERVRLKFTNETMMAHPMHLHGMFVQLENGQPNSKLPNKHTFIIAPGDTYSVLLTADEPGEWAFHCHLLYHMMAGMMSKLVVAKLDENKVPEMKEKTKQVEHQMHKEEKVKPMEHPMKKEEEGHKGHMHHDH